MSLQDPIADMLTRIRNAQQARLKDVSMPSSGIKKAISNVLKEEGYIADFRIKGNNKPILIIDLKFYRGRPLIETLKRVSRPGLRVYRSSADLPKINGGFGLAIVSTSQGVMTDKSARAQNLGGEVLCKVI